MNYLVEKAEALTTLEHAEAYLTATTYNQNRDWFPDLASWYAQVAESVYLIRTGQKEARLAIAREIGAHLLY